MIWTKRRGPGAGRALGRAFLLLMLAAAGTRAAWGDQPAMPEPPAAPAAPTPAAAPAAGGVLTLPEALARALSANPAVARSRSVIAAGEADVRRVRTSILPHVDVEANAIKNSSEVAFDFNGNRAVVLPGNDWNYKLTVSQPIYAGTRELKTLRQGRLAVVDAREAARASDDNLIAATATDFLAVVESDALLGVERTNRELAQKRKTQAQAFFDAGEVTKVDLLRADTDVKAAERRLAAANQQRDEAVSRLRLDLALDRSEPLQVAAPQIPFPALPAVEVLAAAAMEVRAEVKRAEAARDIAALELTKQKLSRLPVVRAEGTIQGQRGNFPADQYGSLAIRFTMPVFDSGEIGAKIAGAEEKLKQAEVTLAETRRSVREEVTRAVLALQTAETTLALAKEQLAAAQAEYDQSFELYRAQEVTSLDAQSAESSLAEARRAVVTEQLRRDLAELSVWYSAGSLKKTLHLESIEEGSK